MLNTYLKQVGSLLHDSAWQFWKQVDVIPFINEARGWIAAEGQCVKVLTPGTNGIASITVTNGGSGYTGTPAVVITGPGTGATATANMVGNAVSTITVNTPGSKYDNSTLITFTGGGGTLAAATPVINCLNTVPNQEIYTFAAANPFVQLTSGVGSILFVQSLACSWGALKPVLEQWNFDDLQAQVRSYPFMGGEPSMWAQFGQGENGSIYLQPVPGQALPMEWNCVCTPIDLVDDTTAEAIPYPWTSAVKYYAAYLAFMNARRPIEANNAHQMYEENMKRARNVSEPIFVPNYYA